MTDVNDVWEVQMRLALILVLIAGFAVATVSLRAGDESVAEQYRARRAAIEDGDANAFCRLAHWCKDNGLAREARESFTLALGVDSENTVARRALGYEKIEGVWLRGDALLKARGFVRLGKRWVLREEAAAYEAKRSEKLLSDSRKRGSIDRASRLVKTLATCEGAERRRTIDEIAAIPAGLSFRPLVAALNSDVPDAMKEGAIASLARHGAKTALRPLIRASVMDPSESVRFSAISAVRAFGVKSALVPLVGALSSPHKGVRSNAIQAIGNLGDVNGIEVVISHWSQHGGGSPRSYMSSVNQLAFIQDFDVEVAQTAFIADPIVGVLQDGIALDVTVHSTARYFTTIEKKLMQGALRQLSGGVDHGNDVKAWVSWYRKEKGQNRRAPDDLKPTREVR